MNAAPFNYDINYKMIVLILNILKDLSLKQMETHIIELITLFL